MVRSNPSSSSTYSVLAWVMSRWANAAILAGRIPELTPKTIPGIGVDLMAGGENLAASLLTLVVAYLLVSFVFNALENYNEWRRHNAQAREGVLTRIGTEFRWVQIAERYMMWRYKSVTRPSESDKRANILRFRNLVRETGGNLTWRDVLSVRYFVVEWVLAGQRVVFSQAVVYPLFDMGNPAALGLLAIVVGWSDGWAVLARIVG